MKLKKKPTNYSEFNCVFLEKKDHLWQLYLDIFRVRYANLSLWSYIQRDVIAALISGYLAIVGLDSHGPIRLNDSIYEKYPCKKNEGGEYSIRIAPDDLRLVTEIIEFHEDLWDYGELVNFVVFPKGNQDLNECDALYRIKPMGDNIGIQIEVNPMENADQLLKRKIEYTLERYNILVKVMEEKN